MRFNEGAPDVMVPNQSESKFQPRLRSVADGRRNAGLGHRQDDVGASRGLPRRLFAHSVTVIASGADDNYRNKEREIDILEEAMREPLRLELVVPMHEASIDYVSISGFVVGDVVSADQ